MYRVCDFLVLPLLRLLHASREVERVVLAYLLIASRTLSVSYLAGCIRIFAELKQHVIAPHYARCLVRADVVRQTKVAKVRLLRALITPETHPALLREFTVSFFSAFAKIMFDAV